MNIRTLFPGYTVAIKRGTFDYLHQDDTAFERRSLPCIHVRVTSKEYHLDKNDRRVYHHPSIVEIMATLRNAGLCAEFNAAHEYGISVFTDDQRPVNRALGLGQTKG